MKLIQQLNNDLSGRELNEGPEWNMTMPDDRSYNYGGRNMDDKYDTDDRSDGEYTNGSSGDFDDHRHGYITSDKDDEFTPPQEEPTEEELQAQIEQAAEHKRKLEDALARIQALYQPKIGALSKSSLDKKTMG